MFSVFSGFPKADSANWDGAVALHYSTNLNMCFFLPKIMSQIKEQSCVYGEMKDREYISWSSHCFINTVAIKFLHGQDSALYFRLLSFLILELVKNFIV